MLKRIISFLIGYIFGLFQTSYIYGIKQGIDIRRYGSYNAGATNTLRIFGKKASVIVFLCDSIKCIISIIIIILFFNNINNNESIKLLELYCGIGCIFGHNYPFYLNFNGGKGISTTIGFIIIYDKNLFIICALIFFIVLFISHYVSLGSLIGYFFFIIGIIIFAQIGKYNINVNEFYELCILSFLLIISVLLKHKNNIIRLISNNENKIF